ncbi:mycofactocin precursor MftA [Citricoccus sp. GCM10030269]
MPEHNLPSRQSVTETEGQTTQDVAELIEEVSIDGMCGVY